MTVRDALETVATYLAVQEAYIASGLLEEYEIESVVLDEHIVSAHPLYAQAVGGIRLAVRSSNLRETARITAELPLHDSEPDEAIEDDPEEIKFQMQQEEIKQTNYKVFLVLVAVQSCYFW